MDKYIPIPENFRKSAPLVYSVDYFDYATGVGYNKFYLAGQGISGSSIYSLTTDSTLKGDNENFRLSGVDATADFDLTFNNPVKIAPNYAQINYVLRKTGTSATRVKWTISHVRGAVVTELGSAYDSAFTLGGAGIAGKSTRVLLTGKTFAVGDKLRITPVLKRLGANGEPYIYLDPVGSLSLTDSLTGATLTTSTSINIPFEVDL